jgi:hypothetical protein
MEQLKSYLRKNKIFTEKELKTLKESQINHCEMCNTDCGQIVKLNECLNKTIICLQCLDNLFDSYQIDKKNLTELFTCICCDQKILSYEII